MTQFLDENYFHQIFFLLDNKFLDRNCLIFLGQELLWKDSDGTSMSAHLSLLLLTRWADRERCQKSFLLFPFSSLSFGLWTKKERRYHKTQHSWTRGWHFRSNLVSSLSVHGLCLKVSYFLSIGALLGIMTRICYLPASHRLTLD